MNINFFYSNMPSQLKKKTIIQQFVIDELPNVNKNFPTISIEKFFPIYQQRVRNGDCHKIASNIQRNVKTIDIPILKQKLGNFVIKINHKDLLIPHSQKKPYFWYAFTPSNKRIRNWFITKLLKQKQEKIFPFLEYSFYQRSKSSLIDYHQFNAALFYKKILVNSLCIN